MKRILIALWNRDKIFLCKYLVLLFLFFGMSSLSQSQNNNGFSTEGTDFWLTFGQNGVCEYPNGGSVPFPNETPEIYTPVDLKIRIVASETTQITISYIDAAGNPQATSTTIQADHVYDLSLDNTMKAAAYNGRPYSESNTWPSYGVSSKALRIQSDKPISAYAMNYYKASSDATNLVPTSRLGTDYYHISYPPYSYGTNYVESRFDGYLVVATEANTTIKHNGTLVATLNSPGDVFYYYGSRNQDLTGAHIKASKPVAYFVSNTGAQVPISQNALEILYQQMFPVNTWGTGFLVPTTNRQKDIVRIIASMNNTIVEYNGGSWRSGGLKIASNRYQLNKGEYLELQIEHEKNENGTFISSLNNQPIAVCAYLVGGGYVTDELLHTQKGDPAMTWIPPIQQFVTMATVSPFDLENIPNHYALVAVKEGTEDQTIATEGASTNIPLNGTWKTNSGYSYYSLSISDVDDVYSFYNPNGLAVLAYGYGGSESYYYLAASAMRNLNPYFTVNSKHYQDVYGDAYCDNTFHFEASIYSRLAGSGGQTYATNSLTWFIKKNDGGFEIQNDKSDLTEWSETLPPARYEIKMTVVDANGEPNSCITQFTVNEPTQAELSGNQSPCIDNEITYTTQSGMSNYEWTVSGTANTDYIITAGGTSTSNTISIKWLTTATQTIEVDFEAANGCATTPASWPVNPQECCPPILVWLGVNSNWDDTQNWYPSKTPDTCTDVYIPGDVNVFPTLASNGSNTCDNIYFLPGAQLGNPQYLTYNQAHVQLDYGKGSLENREAITDNSVFVGIGKDNITSEDRVKFGVGKSGVTLNRERWYLLSAPLKSVLTGDYAFGGFPMSFIRKFDPAEENNDGSTFIKGRWSKYSNETIYEFSAGEGFGCFLYGMENDIYSLDRDDLWNTVAAADGTVVAPAPQGVSGSQQKFGLAESNGIIQLPYYEDSYLSDAHRNHSYNTDTEESTFHFFYQSPKTSSDFMQFTGKTESKKRENAYRFIAENANDDSMDFTYKRGRIENPQSSEFVLIGNPYMSPIYFESFYIINGPLIKDAFQIYDGSSYYISDSDNYIAPMQSFLVELRNDYDGGDLDFEFMSLITQTNPATKLRSNKSDKLKENYLTITAKNTEKEISAYIRKLDDATDAFCNYDMSKIVDYPMRSAIPEIYTTTRNGAENKALIVNSVKSNDITIPLGIITTYSGKISFTLEGMDRYDAKITFIDVENSGGMETDITGMDFFEYEFDYKPALTAKQEAIANEERFKIRFSPRITTANNTPLINLDITAYAYGSDIIALSPTSNPITNIQVFDLQGCLLYSNTDISSSFCKVENVLNTSGVYIVKIETEKGTKKIKLIK